MPEREHPRVHQGGPSECDHSTASQSFVVPESHKTIHHVGLPRVAEPDTEQSCHEAHRGKKSTLTQLQEAGDLAHLL